MGRCTSIRNCIFLITILSVFFINNLWGAVLPTGDFDLDQDVDGADLAVLKENVADGSLLMEDLAVFAANFGQRKIIWARSVTQFGITWTFSQPVKFGSFANGDYWVLGPVTVVHIDPLSTEENGRVMHGSMLDPSPRTGSDQGYDSSMYGNYGPHYRADLNVARPNGQNLSEQNPLAIPPRHSLVSAVSLPALGARPQLKTAAVLTVLEAPPSEGSFRPPYSGADKTIRFHTAQINADLLATLPRVSKTPSLATAEGWFARPFIDHVPNWMSDYHHPQDNLPNYGREIAARIGDGALMLQLDFSPAEKRTLLIRFLQVGIDLHGVLMDGGRENWVPNGGHSSGRKWPIIFAGLIFGDDDLKNVGPGDGSSAFHFGEDGQTFYVSQADVDRVHQPDLRGCFYEPYKSADIGMPEWGIRHSTEPVADNNAWCAVYRQCCTANAWPGFVLAARIMNAKNLWAHDALFDYQDRYMNIQTSGTWQRSWSRFSEEMWDVYRNQF